MKVLSDVTGFLSHRHPLEAGGCYFAFSTIASQASCWIAASLYIAHYPGREGGKIEALTIYIFIGGLQVLWVLTTVLFFSKIKRAYWRTFYSTETAREYVCHRFNESQEDEMKALIFFYHQDLWFDYKDKVRAFSHNNWARWTAEKPKWFDVHFVAKVPDEFIPKTALDDLNRNSVGGKRRRSSMGLLSGVEDRAADGASSGGGGLRVAPEPFAGETTSAHRRVG